MLFRSFSYLGLDYSSYVHEDASAYRPAESALLVGCANKAKNELGWVPEVGLKELVGMMVDADLQKLRERIRD